MNIVKIEYFDEEVMKPILCDDRFNSKDLARLSQYNKHRVNGSQINVSYKFGAGCEEHQLGRLFPDEGLGLQAFRFDLRNPLSKRWYWDTDVENCHYVIALKYCREYGLAHNHVSHYVLNRDVCLKLVCSSRKKAKTEFLKVLYGGDIKLYHDEYQEVEGSITAEGSKFLLDLKNEMNELMDMIWVKHPQFHDLKMGKKPIKKKRNPKASLMSLIFQTCERELLLEWDAFLAENDRYLGVFIHDGGYVQKLDGETEFPIELLNEGSKRLNEKLGYEFIRLTQKEIAHEWKPKVLPLLRKVASDKEACDVIYDELKPRLVYCGNQLFCKMEHIWGCDLEEINAFLLNYILKSNLYDENGRPFSQFVKNAKHIMTALFSRLRSENQINLYEKFHTTTVGRICFQDGVLDFPSRRFYLWADINFEYYSCVMIRRPFVEYFKNPDREIMNRVKKDIFENLYGDKTTKALNFYARAIAGHSRDKILSTLRGKRNCGKGVCYDSLKGSFEDYVCTFELGNLLKSKFDSKHTSEASRMLYWLMALQFVRLGISQETPEPESNLVLNGVLMKKLAGGGDEIVARRNFDRVDTTFKIQTTFQIMGNDEIEAYPADTMNQCLRFYSVNQFLTQDDQEKMIAEGSSPLEMAIYKTADPSIKTLSQTDAWKNAIVCLLLENYISSAVSIDRPLDDEEGQNTSILLRRRILQRFTITRDDADFMLVSKVEDYINGKKKDIFLELQSMGVFKRKHRERDSSFRDKFCYYGLQLIRQEDDTETETDDEANETD